MVCWGRGGGGGEEEEGSDSLGLRGAPSARPCGPGHRSVVEGCLGGCASRKGRGVRSRAGGVVVANMDERKVGVTVWSRGRLRTGEPPSKEEGSTSVSSVKPLTPVICDTSSRTIS
jgi:hypothetical protein